MRVLALDIGQKRVGVAFGDTDHRVAVPLEELALADIETTSPTFLRLLDDHKPDILLCGEPLTMAGEVGPQAQRVEEIARGVAKRCGLEVVFTDERLSSMQAKRILHEQGMNERQMRGKIDSTAASIFLQTWLDNRVSPTMGDSWG